MKGRSLRLDSTLPPTLGRRLRRPFVSRGHRRALTAGWWLGLLAVLVPLTACGGNDAPRAEAAALPAASGTTGLTDLSELADDPVLVAPSTEAPATIESAATLPTETAPATTVPPTVVQTLPVPDPPPPPRANEPYIELGRIQIPEIGIDTTLLQGISLNTLDLGPGHWPGTALPGGVGNAVIAGHRTSHNKVFRNIDQLVPGDEVIFSSSEGDFVYVVRETTIVKPDALYIIEQTNEPTATLFACHPPGSTRERIVVHLDLSSSPTGAPSV